MYCGPSLSRFSPVSRVAVLPPHQLYSFPMQQVSACSHRLGRLSVCASFSLTLCLSLAKDAAINLQDLSLSPKAKPASETTNLGAL